MNWYDPTNYARACCGVQIDAPHAPTHQEEPILMYRGPRRFRTESHTISEVIREWFAGLLDEWQRRAALVSSPKDDLRPIEDEPFSYPPGFVPEAFWFRLDFSGPRNPRDPGFEWAWEKPLLPVGEVFRRDGYKPSTGEQALLSLIDKNQDRIAEALGEPAPLTRGTAGQVDNQWTEYMASEYVCYEEYEAVKAGKLPCMAQRLRDFDDR